MPRRRTGAGRSPPIELSRPNIKGMEPKEKSVRMDAPAREQQEPPAVGLLLNAPGILSKLIDTAVLLSLLTGVLYAWGSVYFSAFIEGLGLERYAFAFNPPPNEILFGGAYTLSYLIPGLPAAYWSVGMGLGAVFSPHTLYTRSVCAPDGADGRTPPRPCLRSTASAHDPRPAPPAFWPLPRHT